MRFYSNRLSGNCYKVRLLLDLLGIKVEEVEIDIFRSRETHPDFLARSPEGKVPVIEFDDGTVLAESGAILFHLACGSPYLPDAALVRSEILQWMFFEQNQHEPSVAVARSLQLYSEPGLEREVSIQAVRAKGQRALGTMERHLKEREFFVRDFFTIADIALYPYTRRAEEGGFSLQPYPAVRSWLGRVESVPGFVPFVTEGPVEIP
ncbi:MAG: glutathione S-transferase family protein [Euryarchaeota archaeon]|nr:glutathione S-transferase family protein [Euryarchaeota archaeon]